MFERFEPEEQPIESPQVGGTIGNFRLLEEIGDGAMAIVYRAEHLSTNRQVALKVLHAEFCARMDIVRRFFRERLVVKRAWHPNILDIAEVVAGEGHPPFLIMELLQGEDLGRYLDRMGRLSVDQAVTVAVQVCSALGAIHARNIVHRDLKPANLFLLGVDDGYPVVKLLDFGLSKFLYEDDPYMRSRPGAFLGTPEYMAPEQIGGGELSDLVDVYAMGALLYEMITGSNPFRGENFQASIKAVLEVEPDPPSLHAPTGETVSQTLDNIILRCLAKNPEHRIQGVDRLKALLLSTQDPRSTVEVAPPPRKLRPWQWAAGGIAAASLLGLAVWMLMLS
ncbi:MAG: serine/threonine-protein kinase [bacterium]